MLLYAKSVWHLAILNREALCKIFDSLSSESRLEALEFFEGNKELTQIAKLTGMSRSGFQKVVEAFREIGVIEPAGHRSYYKLSSKGEKVLKLLRSFGEQLGPIEKEMAKEKIKAVAFGSGLTREDMLKILQDLKEPKK
jgi:predicted transcriptional regulator